MNARTHDMKLAIGVALVIGLPMVARAQQIKMHRQSLRQTPQPL